MSYNPRDYTHVGFWPDIPGPPPSALERKFLPEKSKLMDQDIAEARAACLKVIEATSDEAWKTEKPDEYAAVLTYLKNPEHTEAWRGYSSCRVCGFRPNGHRDFFKGTFIYPEGYAHYVEEHGVKPPAEMIEAAMKAD